MPIRNLYLEIETFGCHSETSQLILHPSPMLPSTTCITTLAKAERYELYIARPVPQDDKPPVGQSTAAWAAVSSAGRCGALVRDKPNAELRPCCCFTGKNNSRFCPFHACQQFSINASIQMCKTEEAFAINVATLIGAGRTVLVSTARQALHSLLLLKLYREEQRVVFFPGPVGSRTGPDAGHLAAITYNDAAIDALQAFCDAYTPPLPPSPVPDPEATASTLPRKPTKHKPIKRKPACDRIKEDEIVLEAALHEAKTGCPLYESIRAAVASGDADLTLPDRSLFYSPIPGIVQCWMARADGNWLAVLHGGGVGTMAGPDKFQMTIFVNVGDGKFIATQFTDKSTFDMPNVRRAFPFLARLLPKTKGKTTTGIDFMMAALRTQERVALNCVFNQMVYDSRDAVSVHKAICGSSLLDLVEFTDGLKVTGPVRLIYGTDAVLYDGDDGTAASAAAQAVLSKALLLSSTRKGIKASDLLSPENIPDCGQSRLVVFADAAEDDATVTARCKRATDVVAGVAGKTVGILAPSCIARHPKPHNMSLLLSPMGINGQIFDIIDPRRVHAAARFTSCVIFEDLDTSAMNPKIALKTPHGKWFPAKKTFDPVVVGDKTTVVCRIRHLPDAFDTDASYEESWTRFGWIFHTIDAAAACTASRNREWMGDKARDPVAHAMCLLGGFVRADGSFVPVDGLDSPGGYTRAVDVMEEILKDKK